jgi:Polysaccharide pyruvyl transferase
VPEQRAVRLFTVRPDTTNIGNDLIALATESLLAAVWDGPVEVVSVPAAGVPGAVKGDGLDARNVYEANRLADGVLVGGGNVFENGGLHVDLTALDALEVPLATVGVSSGRVYGRRGELTRRTDTLAPERVRALCRHAAPLLVRDDATAALLESIGVDSAVVAGCPTLFLDRFLRDAPAPDPDMAGTALLSVRHPRLMSLSYACQDQVRADIRAIAADLAAGYDRVALVCHDYQDLAFAAAFPELASLYTEDARRLLAWLRGCAVSVTYRLHAFLPCVAFGVPSVHVSYDERGEAMVETLGVEDWNVPMPATDDVAGEVRARVHEAAAAGRTPRLDAEPALDRLSTLLVAGVEAFARRVADADDRKVAVP